MTIVTSPSSTVPVRRILPSLPGRSIAELKEVS